MFSPLSECRESPAELVCQLDPQVAHLEMMVTMATISTPHGAADVEILTLIDGRVAPVVLEGLLLLQEQVLLWEGPPLLL